MKRAIDLALFMSYDSDYFIDEEEEEVEEKKGTEEEKGTGEDTEIEKEMNEKELYKYALKLYDGDGVDENVEEAAKIFKRLADKGNDKAMFKYACMLRDGDGVEEDMEEAEKYFKEATDKGNTRAEKEYKKILETKEEANNMEIIVEEEEEEIEKNDNEIVEEEEEEIEKNVIDKETYSEELLTSLNKSISDFDLTKEEDINFDIYTANIDEGFSTVHNVVKNLNELNDIIEDVTFTDSKNITNLSKALIYFSKEKDSSEYKKCLETLKSEVKEMANIYTGGKTLKEYYNEEFKKLAINAGLADPDINISKDSVNDLADKFSKIAEAERKKQKSSGLEM